MARPRAATTPASRSTRRWQTGVPFNITNAAARANTGGAERRNLVGNPDLEDPTINRYFDAFGTITNTIGTPRQMQFAAKLSF